MDSEQLWAQRFDRYEYNLIKFKSFVPLQQCKEHCLKGSQYICDILCEKGALRQIQTVQLQISFCIFTI